MGHDVGAIVGRFVGDDDGNVEGDTPEPLGWAEGICVGKTVG